LYCASQSARQASEETVAFEGLLSSASAGEANSSAATIANNDILIMV
jgi:hypothetical protein